MTSAKTQILIKFLQLPVVVGLFIIWPAGTFDFWQVYVYFGMLVGTGFFVLLYFLRHDPALVERRLRTREKEQTQKTVVFLLLLLVIAGFMLPGFDRRFGWSEIPVFIILLADLFVVCGYLFIAYVMKINSFASRIIEVEADQKVITTGPYSLIRHPMYAGVVVMFLATPIALGSWWGLIPFAFVPLLLVPRMVNEENLLRKELPGYDEYCNAVRWRLIPGMW